jgi:putative acetyltransferase
LKKLTLRNGKLEDLAELQQLFVDTVKTICRKDYNTEQIKVWTSGIENIERWAKIFTSQYVLIAEQENKIVGFATLENGNYIDLFYVHKDFQRKEIAKKLYKEIEAKAKLQRQTKLTSDVSKTAKPFFKHVGFEEIKEQKIIRKGVELINFKMIKELSNEDKTNEK